MVIVGRFSYKYQMVVDEGLFSDGQEHDWGLDFGLHASNIILLVVKIFAGLTISDCKFCLD